MSEFYGPNDEAESLATLNYALDRGVTHLDTADMYGYGRNEELLSKLLKTRRREVFLATKFGLIRDPEDPRKRTVSGRPEYVRAACDASLQRLGTDVIDLYYAHRIDPLTPVEETVSAMAELVRAGKVRYLGLSEAGASTLRRAQAVHPIAAVQTEYSLWSRDVEERVIPACRELGIALVSYSPLGRGFLAGRFKSIDDFAPDDQRLNQPRFQGENFAKNLELVARVKEIAAGKGCTAGQLALAWVLAQGDFVLPIPGTSRIRHLDENIGALGVRLSIADLAEIERVCPASSVSGARYPEQMMRLLDTVR